MLPKVSIVILNWNNYKDTKECLESLEKIVYPNHEIIIVDNGSADGSGVRLQEEFSRYDFIRNEENLGFAGGTNVGLKHALTRRADYVLLLNNDTVVKPDFLSEMVETAEEDEAVGLVSGKIYRYGTHSIHHAGGRLVLWRAKGYSFTEIEAPHNGGSKNRNVSFIIGCSMLIKSRMIEDIGFLDERHFCFGGEDVEYCWRAGKACWQIKVNLHAEVWHKVSVSAGGEASPFLFYHSTRNRLYFARQLGNRDRLLFYAFFSVTRLARLLQWKLAGDNELIRATTWGIKDFIKGETGIGRYVPNAR